MQIRQILIINGPNLNLLGRREKEIYGHRSFEEYLERLRLLYGDRAEISYLQSNIEGELIDALHKAALDGKIEAVILNAGGYTHTSVSLGDAVRAVCDMGLPVVEVHISNLTSREPFRHTSLITPHCRGSIMGFGMDCYRLALEYFLQTEPQK